MTPNEYIEAVQRTKSSTYYPPIDEIKNHYPRDGFLANAVDVEHGIIGVATEGGEMLECLKKSLFYGKDFDIPNLKEEIGDLLWYTAVLLKANGWTFEEIMELNIKKLKTRYPDKFSKDKAINRDLEAERKIFK